MTELLVNQIDVAPTRWTASELEGSLVAVEHYAEFSLADLETTVSDLSEAVFNSRFETGWAALTWLAKQSHGRVSERVQALEKLADGARMSRADLRDWVRVGRAFAPGLVKPYQDKPWTWFVEIASRTRYAGPIGTPERAAEIETVAAATSEETCAETRAAIERRRAEALGRGAFLETDEEPEQVPHPAEHELPPPAAPVVELGKPAEDRLRKQLLAAYVEWQPGTALMVADMVLEVLREGGWTLTGAMS